MAEFVVNGTWKAHPLHGTELIIDLSQASSVQLQHGDVGDIVGDPGLSTTDGSAVGKSILVTVLWSNGAIGEYTGTVRTTGRLSRLSADRCNPEYGSDRFRYKRFS